MKGLNLEAVANVCNGKLVNFDANTREVSSVVTDSRKVEKDTLFIAIKGNRVDGHDFVNQVFDAGAMCCVVEHEVDTDGCYIVVESTLQALKDIAEYYRSCLDIKVVGITGSVGKTSTKETISAVLSQKYNVLKTQGNFNNEVGLPLTVFNLRDEHEVAVLEMGISGFGEMRRLAKVARPDICVITNIGDCHLENLGSRDGVLKAKTEIFEFMKDGGRAVLNGDDAHLRTVKEVCGAKPIFFGDSSDCDVTTKSKSNRGLEGTDVSIVTANNEINARVPVPGVHMVHNAMAAVAVGELLGLNATEIAAGIESLKTIAGRSNIIKTKEYIVIDDCYNANPMSMKASSDVLNDAVGRKVCVLGDMFELGENEKELHYSVGEHISHKSIDLVVTIGKLSEYIKKGIDDAKCGIETVHFADKDEFFENAKKLLKAGDNILVKASHGMEFTKIVDFLQNGER